MTEIAGTGSGPEGRVSELAAERWSGSVGPCRVPERQATRVALLVDLGR